MDDAHGMLALVALVIAAAAAATGFYAYRRGRTGHVVAHLLTLAQTLLIAQVALGLLLLSAGARTVDRLHYLYGFLSLVAVLSPWLYAPPVPSRRLAWFTGATLFATALSVRAYTTAG